MCGRFTLHHTTQEVAERFAVEQILFEPPPRYNVAPSQPLAVVTNEPEDGGRCLKAYQWGLIPSWAKDPKIGNRLINARAETLAEKPAFRAALRRRRCIIPADGFYEWKHLDGAAKKGARQPLHIGLRDDKVFGFAGLWEEWISDDGSPLRTCTIITTAPNELMATIHDRMPAILRPEDEALWLAPTQDNVPQLMGLLGSYPASEMTAHHVSLSVNSPSYDGPDCIAPVES